MKEVKNLRPRTFRIVACIVAILVVCGFAGVAHASPLLAPPPASQSLSEAPALDGTIHSVTHKKVKQNLQAMSREEVQFGTGVDVGGEPEVGTMNVLTPANPDGTVVAYAPATDSLSPWDAPSIKINGGTLGKSDIERINALLAAGKTVVLVDAYGPAGLRAYGLAGPQYAGVMNGVRIANGIEAYRRSHPDAPAWCYGFSGGGIDCARVAEYQYARGIGLVIDSGPTDLPGFLAKSAVQNGLGFDAAAGVVTSLPADDQTVLFQAMRPSAIVGYKALRFASDILPVPQLTTGIMALGGVLVPLPYTVAFREGALDDPAIQRVLARLSPSVRAGGYDGIIVERCNASDAFVPCDTHARPFADQAGAVVITNHGQAAPGHAMMDVEQLIALVDGNVPTADLDTYNKAMSPIAKVQDFAVSRAMDGISLYGEWLNEQAPPVLDQLDNAVVSADQALDQVAEAPQVAADAVQTATSQGQQLLADVTTPQREASTQNSETLVGISRDVLSTQDAGKVESFINTTPGLKQVLNNAPVTIPRELALH